LEDIDNPMVFTIDGKRKYAPLTKSYKTIAAEFDCECLWETETGCWHTFCGGGAFSHIGLIGLMVCIYGKPKGRHLSKAIKIALELVLIAILVY